MLLKARVGLGVIVMKGCSAFSKPPALLEPLYQIVQCHIQDTLWRGNLSIYRDRVGILQPQPIGLFDFWKTLSTPSLSLLPDSL